MCCWSTYVCVSRYVCVPVCACRCECVYVWAYIGECECACVRPCAGNIQRPVATRPPSSLHTSDDLESVSVGASTHSRASPVIQSPAPLLPLCERLL